MVYHVIGTMSGSSMDGLDVVHCTFEEIGGQWNYAINEAVCIPFPEVWKQTLAKITHLSAKELLLAHSGFGKWMGERIQEFITDKQLTHRVHLIASHGHTVFHEPHQGMTFQMGDGAQIATITQLPVVTDLRNMDVALGGQGAPIVPIGEKLLWKNYRYFLNIGGIANLTKAQDEDFVAYDICPANRVLNALAYENGSSYDDKGLMAAKGTICDDLLNDLNDLAYYQKPYPKSLSNEYGLDIVLSVIHKYAISVEDKLRTMVAHIVEQIAAATKHQPNGDLLVTGGGAYNDFLIHELKIALEAQNISLVVPEAHLIEFKEALIMGLIGVLRWREEVNVLSSVTGATRNSIGGALWMGQE